MPDTFAFWQSSAGAGAPVGLGTALSPNRVTQTDAAALASAGRTAAEVDVILTASCTGIATPGIKARLAEGIEFRPAALHMPTFGWGCAGGAPRLPLAVTLLNAVAMPVRIPAKAWALRRG